MTQVAAMVWIDQAVFCSSRDGSRPIGFGEISLCELRSDTRVNAEPFVTHGKI